MQNSPKASLSVIRILHLALMAGPTIFGLVVIFLHMSGEMAVAAEDGILVYIPAVILAIAFPASGILFKKNLSAISQNAPLQSKLAAYQTAHIIRMALFEAAAFFAVVVCFITGNLYNMIVLALVLGVFLTKIPSAFLLESELKLSSDEKAQLT